MNHNETIIRLFGSVLILLTLLILVTYKVDCTTMQSVELVLKAQCIITILFTLGFICSIKDD